MDNLLHVLDGGVRVVARQALLHNGQPDPPPGGAPEVGGHVRVSIASHVADDAVDRAAREPVAVGPRHAALRHEGQKNRLRQQGHVVRSPVHPHRRALFVLPAPSPVSTC